MAEPLAREQSHAIAQAAARDFGPWMLSEQRRIFLLCQRMLQDRDEADMATQDAFLKAYRAMTGDSGLSVDEPSKWITRIAVNTCLDRLRSRTWKFWRRRPSQEDEETILTMTAASGPSQEDLLFAREVAGRLETALAKLSPRQRAVFALKHFEDRKLEEIAEILQLDLGTVKAHMARAVAKLRNELRDLYEARR